MSMQIQSLINPPVFARPSDVRSEKRESAASEKDANGKADPNSRIGVNTNLKTIAQQNGNIQSDASCNYQTYSPTSGTACLSPTSSCSQSVSPNSPTGNGPLTLSPPSPTDVVKTSPIMPPKAAIAIEEKTNRENQLHNGPQIVVANKEQGESVSVPSAKKEPQQTTMPTVPTLPPLRSIPEGESEIGPQKRPSLDSTSVSSTYSQPRVAKRPQSIQVIRNEEFRELKNTYDRMSSRSSITPHTATTPSVWSRGHSSAGAGGAAAATLIDMAMGLPSPQYLYMGQRSANPYASPSYPLQSPLNPSSRMPTSHLQQPAFLDPATNNHQHGPHARPYVPHTPASIVHTPVSPEFAQKRVPGPPSPSAPIRPKPWSGRQRSAGPTPTSNLPVYTHLFGAHLPPILSDRSSGMPQHTIIGNGAVVNRPTVFVPSPSFPSPPYISSPVHTMMPPYAVPIPPPRSASYGPSPVVHNAVVSPPPVPRQLVPSPPSGAPTFCVRPKRGDMPPAVHMTVNSPDASPPRDQNYVQCKIPRRGPFRPPIPVTVTTDAVVINEPKNLCAEPHLLEMYKNTKGPRPSQGLLDRLHSDQELWKKANKIKKGYFSCVHCGRRFATLAKYAEHIELFSVERPYLCREEDCPWSIVGFYKKTELSRHEKSQHGWAIFACTEPHCDRSFTRKDSLKRHLGFVHAGPPRPWSKRAKQWKSDTPVA